ncbi:hypothetical protein BKH43_02450 [Helicobacter sp. 13S00401-1]|nr:hypothetical protein BKH43_02450 [Helicobacter sp. 13S00401-1]
MFTASAFVSCSLGSLSSFVKLSITYTSLDVATFKPLKDFKANTAVYVLVKVKSHSYLELKEKERNYTKTLKIN